MFSVLRITHQLGALRRRECRIGAKTVLEKLDTLDRNLIQSEEGRGQNVSVVSDPRAVTLGEELGVYYPPGVQSKLSEANQP